MKTRRIAQILACVLVMLMVLTACSVKPEAKSDPAKEITLKMAVSSNYEVAANVLRDELKKIGITLEVDIFSDFGAFNLAFESGDYDVTIMDVTGSGSPDSALRSVFHSQGDYNMSKISDPNLDALLDKAATETPEVYANTYAQIEKLIYDEQTYSVPLLRVIYNYCVNSALKAELFTTPGVYLDFQDADYTDPALRETRPFTIAISMTPFSFDTLRGSDGSTYLTTQNCNIRMLRLDADRNITTDGALTKEYAVGEGNDSFYFLLRDDITYGRVENDQAIDTGVVVSAEDVIYSFKRGTGEISTPTNMASGYLSTIKTMEIITDVAALDEAKVSGTDTGIKTYFEDKIGTELKLAATRDDINGANGSYQVLKITTQDANPQFLTNLTATQVGIVNCDVVSKANEGITEENYDASTMVMYGDPGTLRKGDSYNNNMWFSGPYCINYIDDYGYYLLKNPGFAPGTSEEPMVKNVTVKQIPDSAAQYTAFRNGDIDWFQATASTYDTLKDDTSIKMITTGRLNIYGVYFRQEAGKPCNDINLRKAIAYAVNQDDHIAATGGYNAKVGSLLVMLNTGREHVYDIAKAQDYLAKVGG